MRIAKLLIVILVAASLSGCGSTLSGRLNGSQYTSKTGDLSCSFEGLTRDMAVGDYSDADGEWISSNLSGVDIERIERFTLGKGKVPSGVNANSFVDVLLPIYTAKSERVQNSTVIERKAVKLQTGRDAIFTLIAFDTFTPQNNPQRSRDVRGILWFVGDRYATAMHAYNWRYSDKDGEKIMARLMAMSNRCTLRG
jgi:hypothetical protein